MQLSTKTLASLLVVTAVAVAVPGMSRLPGNKRRQESQFDRLLHKHDRKGELRAAVLNIDPAEFRALRKKHTFEEIARHHGFKSTRAFRIALLGKLKDTLRQKGWSANRISRYMMSRSGRLG